MFPNAHRRTRIPGQPCWIALAAVLILGTTAPAAGPWSVLVQPDNSLSFSFLRDGQPVLHTGLIGFSYFAPDNKVMNNGKAPILLEPVKATVTAAGRPIEAVNILDHDGRRTGRTLPVVDGRFTLDGAKDRAIYYELVWADARRPGRE